MNTPRVATLRRFPDNLDEVLFLESNDGAQAQRYSRLRRAGLLKQLYRGIYTPNIQTDEADIVRRHWSTIISHLAPGAVISHRSQFDSRPMNGAVYATRVAGARKLELPGLTFHALLNTERGPITQAERPGARDIPFKNLYIASQARGFLENLTADKRLSNRQLARADLEAQLDRVLTLRGERGLNALRDDAREVAHRLGMSAEFKTLDGLIGALLGTHSSQRLSSAQALARARGLPYDPDRVSLLESLAADLRNFPFADLEEPARAGDSRTLFAFTESYFSNYIEGTTFTVEEAEEIVFHGKLIAQRSEDSHDILGTFRAALRDPFYSQPPSNAREFLEWLQRANREIMGGRPDRQPGEIKSSANQAGTTLFVVPELVRGTLAQAWSYIETLPHPMQKALFGMFAVAEIHPFTDGNGRSARLLMNCFLSAGQQCRIIVPTIFRADYLLSLKALTHKQDSTAYIRAMRLCQTWTAELDFKLGLAGLNRQLDLCNAKLEEPTDIRRLRSPLTGEDMAVPE